jgi:hypothetical protein
MAGDIESLAFFKDRVERAGSNGYQINRVTCNDRTVAVVKRWMALNDELKTARAATMQTLEASEGKGGIVVLKIADKPRFDGLQATISSHNEQISALEKAIKRLDEMGGPWYSELSDRVGGCGRVELIEKQQIARMSAGYLQKASNSGKTPDEILSSDPEFIRLKALSEEQITQANEQLKTLRPQLAEIDSILKAVGC